MPLLAGHRRCQAEKQEQTDGQTAHGGLIKGLTGFATFAV
jgi:hypothetical protein